MATPRNMSPEVETELRRIMAQHPGRLLTLHDVMEAATDSGSILHRYFTWDDTAAARKWRVQEAQMLVRSFHFTVEERQLKVRALTSLELDRMRGGGYRWTRDVLDRADLRQEMLNTALRELLTLRDKYVRLEELSEVWGAVAEVDGQVNGNGR